eukprot:1191115-Prymnesium_polylepis.1
MLVARPAAIVGGLAGWCDGAVTRASDSPRLSSPTCSLTRTVRLRPALSRRLRRPGLLLSVVMSAPIPAGAQRTAVECVYVCVVCVLSLIHISEPTRRS